MLGELIALFGNKGVRVVSSSDGMGDAFGPGSHASRHARCAVDGPPGFDPYRRAFGDCPNLPLGLRAADRNRAGGRAALNGQRPFANRDVIARHLEKGI